MASFGKRASLSIAVILVALGSLALYLVTMAPSLSLGHGGSDGAELAVAVHTLGVPHPTGYPTYVLLGQLFRVLPWGSLAGRLNLFSACAAAATVGLVSLLAAELLLQRGISNHRDAERTGKPRGWNREAAEHSILPRIVAASTAGLALAAAGLFWSEAVRAEVYTLHTLFLALGMLFLLRWRRCRDANLPLAGLFLGLGLGNHLSLFFLLAAAAFFLLVARPRPHPGEALLAAGLLLVGLAVYLYLPLRAAADPWLDWGDPQSWPAFWAHVGGQPYQSLLLRVPPAQAAGRIPAAVRLLLGDLLPLAAWLGLAGLLVQARRDRPALALTALPAGLGLLLAATYGGARSQAHLLPLYLAWALWAGLAAGEIAIVLQRRLGGKVARIALLLPLCSIALLPWRWPQLSLRADLGPLPTQVRLLAELPRAALLLTNRDEQTFPLWYGQVVDGSRPDLAIVDVRLLEWPWYRRQLPVRYPGLAVPAQVGGMRWVQALLEANPSRPAFTLGPLPLPDGYRLQNVGPAYQVIQP